MKQTSEFFIHRCPECGRVAFADTPTLNCGCPTWSRSDVSIFLPNVELPEPLKGIPVSRMVPKFRGRIETEIRDVTPADLLRPEEEIVTTLTIRSLTRDPQPFLIDKEIARQLNETIRIQFEALREKKWKERYDVE